jgi:hypothetical protein
MATGDVLVYVDADCRAPLTWLERIERRFQRRSRLIALSGRIASTTGTGGGACSSALDVTLAPATQTARQIHSRIGTIFYGGTRRRADG